MRKNVLMIFALLVSVVPKVFGSPVDRMEAMQKACEFMQARGIEVSKDMRMVQSISVPRRAQAQSQPQTLPAYYIFNNGENKGFVIVSGDDRCYPILGYSDTGSFCEDNVPDNLAALLQQFSDQIALLDEPIATNLQEEQEGGVGVSHVSQAVKSAISPMLRSEWGQRAPFNNSCPIADTLTSERCPTGCVSTAMAQILYYYKDRNVKTLQNNIDAYTTSNGLAVSGSSKGQKLDWDNMLDVYVGTETAAQKKAVADLMFYCGSSLKQAYRLKGSGGSTTYICESLNKIFGYYPGCRIVNRTSYTCQDWDNLIYNELANHRPVLYGGHTKSNGHMFVVDGYDGDDFYHINWGWSGSLDGYFHLSALRHDDQESLTIHRDGWTVGQTAVIGIQPLNGLQLEDTTPVLTSRITSYNSYTYSLSTRFYNFTNEDGVFSYGYAVKDNAGNLQIVGTPINNKQVSKYSFDTDPYLSYDYKLKSADLTAINLRSGSYKLVPVCKSSVDNTWQECIRWNSLSGTYLSFDYKATSSTPITNVQMHPVVSLKATKIEATGSHVVKVDQTIRLTIENISEDDFCDRLFLFASQSATSLGGTYKDVVGLYLAPGEKVEVEMMFKPDKVGTWYVAASTNYTGATNIGYAPINIISGSTEKNLGVENIIIYNKGEQNGSNYKVYGNSITGKATIVNLSANAYFSGSIAVVLRQKNTTSSVEFTAESHHIALVLGPGEKKDVDIDFYDLDRNVYLYKVVFYYTDANRGLANDPISKFTLLPGVNYFDVDGTLISTAPTSPYEVPEDALSVDFTGVTGSNGVKEVVTNSNPNTIYFLGKNDVTPSGLTGKNVVKDGTISKLQLTDGYNFATSSSFMAENVEFSITPTIAATGTGGWFTLALPFACNKVVQGSKTIDWFHNATDYGKHFWLKEFVGLTGNKVVFDFVDNMRANTPYIIAVPGANYGPNWNLVGKKMTFKGVNQEIVAGAKMVSTSDVFIFAGTTVKNSLSGIWVLNNAGTRFSYGNYELAPFRAYFRLRTSMANAPENLVIFGCEDDTDAIAMPVAIEGNTVSVYNLSGIKVADARVTNGSVDLENLPNGVYIVNGQKYIK